MMALRKLEAVTRRGAQKIAETPKFPPCSKCGGRGFTNIQRFKQSPPGFVSGASVMQNGVACDCPAGAWFAEQQMEWMKPMPAERVPERSL